MEDRQLGREADQAVSGLTREREQGGAGEREGGRKEEREIRSPHTSIYEYEYITIRRAEAAPYYAAACGLLLYTLLI